MTDATAPIRRSIVVRCTPERAFEVFTSGLDTWWPLDTHARADETEGATTERVEFPTEAGRPILEHTSTGEALSWGEVLVYEPPTRVVIAWKPNDRDQPATEVEVAFTPEGERTRVHLEHRGWERLGERAAEARQGYEGGWVFVFDERYGAAANAA